MRMWRLVVGASFLGAGALALACSSSSSPPAATGGTDSGGSDDGGGGGEEAAVEAAACTPSTMNVSTLDGGAVWACYQAGCNAMGLTACGADCVCNNAILAALACVQTMGESASMSCFESALTPVISESAVSGVTTCLEDKGPGCGLASGDAGEGGAKEDGGDAGAPESSTSDAPSTDAPVDSPAEGG
jgi:hypothetical protein